MAQVVGDIGTDFESVERVGIPLYAEVGAYIVAAVAVILSGC